MRVVYEAEHLIDAHLMKNALEQAGIPAYIRGEHLTGAMGELPPLGLVAVCVPAAAWPEAAQLVAELRPAVVVTVSNEDADPGCDVIPV